MRVMSLASVNNSKIGLICVDYTYLYDSIDVITRAMGFDNIKAYLTFFPGYSEHDLDSGLITYGGLPCEVKYNKVFFYFEECINFLYSDKYPPNAMLFLVPAREDMEAFIEGLEADRQKVYL